MLSAANDLEIIETWLGSRASAHTRACYRRDANRLLTNILSIEATKSPRQLSKDGVSYTTYPFTYAAPGYSTNTSTVIDDPGAGAVLSPL